MTNAEQNQLNHSVFYFRNRAENRRCESNTECTVCLMKNPMDQPQWLPTISSGLNKVKARLSEWHYLVCLTCCFKYHTKWRNLSLENINPINPQRNKPSSTRNLTPDAPLQARVRVLLSQYQLTTEYPQCVMCSSRFCYV